MSVGPYETEQQVRADCDWARRVPVAAGSHITPNTTRLLRACTDAGVDLGAYDWRIIDWLATWEDTTVQVVAGLIARAYAAGVQAGGAQ